MEASTANGLESNDEYFCQPTFLQPTIIPVIVLLVVNAWGGQSENVVHLSSSRPEVFIHVEWR
ncbi:hypothetical protein WG66_013325 [Moniliophthora roreri]|uniref:Uncharacterized protein n=1 Tax=Moniliophthora roreri TaxID=221103 RepID=A0A0W0FVA2_MONRR|nr:hypothetical protein WG66_013325 [Moniliophthora roreri]